jgi:hypothetical protein
VTGAESEIPSTFPAIQAPPRERIGNRAPLLRTPFRLVKHAVLSNAPPPPSTPVVINRADIVWLGISSGVMGCLVGGMMLGIGMDLIVNGQPLGWLLMLPGAPVSAIPGWLLGRRLAQQL